MEDSLKSKEELIAELQALRNTNDALNEGKRRSDSLFKLLEDKKNKNEEIFDLAFSTSPDSVSVTRLSDGMYLSVNKGFCDILGYSKENVVGRTSMELNIWNDPEVRDTFVKELLEKGKMENFEALFLTQNGKPIPALISASLVELNGIPCIIAITKEISDRRKIEDELKTSQFLVNALMNNVDDHIYFKDRESRFIRINKSHARSFGLNDPAEATGKTDFDFFPEESARLKFESEQEILRTGTPVIIEEKLIRSDQSEKWVLSTKLPLTDFDENIIGTFGISRDITAQKISEQQILMHANALRSVREAVSITDMDDNILYVNDAFYKIYGYSKDDLQNKSVKLMRSPNNPPDLVNEILPATLLGGWSGELLNRKKDGSEFTIFLSTSVVRDEKDEPICLIGVASDISDRKKVENALKQSEEHFRSVSKSALDAIITANNNGIIIGWNKGAEKIFGYSEEEIKGRSLVDIVPPDYRESHGEGIRRLDVGGEMHVIGNTVELEGLRKSGVRFPLELSLSNWQTSEGLFYTGIIRDITVRKRMLLENEVIFEITRGITSTGNLNEFLKLVHHSLSKIVYAGNFFVALYNKKKRHFTFPYFVDKFDQEPTSSEMKKSCSSYVFKTGKPLLLSRANFEQLKQENEVELVGSPSPSWVGIPLQTPSEIIGVFVLQHYENENTYAEKDLNFLSSVGSQIAVAIERRLADEMIMLKNELLLVINAEKDKLFSIIAHDLKNPFNAIIGFSNLLSEKIQEKDYEGIEEFAGIIQESSQRAMALLMNLLEWSRSQTGRIVFSPNVCDINALIHEVTELLKGAAKQKSISILAKTTENLTAFADKAMISTILRNLVSNAIKYTHQGGEIVISCELTQNHLLVSVGDSGVGIDKDFLQKLFRIDENLSTPGTEDEKGTGLGLILCKEFVEKHGGKIWVESEVGKGSTFFISIPQRKV